MVCACSGDLQTAIRAKADIFESDTMYGAVFPRWLSIGHIFAVQALGWAYDRLKQELKAKGDLTENRAEADPTARLPGFKTVFDLRHRCFAGGGGRNPDALVDSWLKVLRSILPIVVQVLPAEEYQVVRSTEHTDSVAKKTKGLIAGLQILQSSFEDLRKLLKPLK